MKVFIVTKTENNKKSKFQNPELLSKIQQFNENLFWSRSVDAFSYSYQNCHSLKNRNLLDRFQFLLVLCDDDFIDDDHHVNIGKFTSFICQTFLLVKHQLTLSSMLLKSLKIDSVSKTLPMSICI